MAPIASRPQTRSFDSLFYMMTQINQQRQAVLVAVTQSSKHNKAKYVLFTVDKWLELWVDICALLREMDITGELVRKLLANLSDRILETQTAACFFLITLNHNCFWTFPPRTNSDLEEQFLGVLGAITEMGRAYVAASAAWGSVEM